VQQLPHDGDVGLQGFLPASDELVEEGGDAGFVLHRDERRHGEHPANVGVAALRDARGLVDGGARLAGAGVEPGVRDPLTTVMSAGS